MRHPEDLQGLIDDLRAEIHTLTERLHRKVQEVQQALAGNAASIDPGRPPLIATAYNIAQTRRSRSKYFPAALFHERAWDMLLELYISHVENRDVWVKDLISATVGSPSTAMRWLDHLAAIGMITRRADEEDRRRVVVNLTGKGEAAMNAFLQDVGSLPASRSIP